jgi:hypothetical protein
MELKALNHRQEFPYAIAEMSFRLGVIRGRLAEKCNDTAPAGQIVIRANSILPDGLRQGDHIGRSMGRKSLQ